MPDDFQKNVVVSVTTDTGQASKDITDLKTQVDSIGNADVATPFKSLRLELRQATADAQIAFQQFGKFSPQFVEATEKAAAFKDQVRQYQATVAAFDPANKLEAIVGVARGATGAVQGVAGAMALFGTKTEDSIETIRRLQGLMAFSEALSQITLLRNSWTAFTTVIQTSSAYIAINNGLTKAAATIQGLFGIAVDETAVSFKVLKGAIVATGIGLLIVAIGELIAHWDDIKKALSSTTEEQRIMNKVFDDASKSIGGEVSKILLLKQKLDDLSIPLTERKKLADEYNLTADAGNKLDTTQLNNLTLINGQIANQISLLKQRAVEKASENFLAEKYAAVFAAQQKSDEDNAKRNIIVDPTGHGGINRDIAKLQEAKAALATKQVTDALNVANAELNKGLAAVGKYVTDAALITPTTTTGTPGTPPTSNFEELERQFQSHLDAIKRIKDEANKKDVEGLSKRNQELVQADSDYNTKKDELDKQATLDAKALEGKNLTPEQEKEANVLLLKIQQAHDDAQIALLQQYREKYQDIIKKFNASDYKEALASQDALAVGLAKGNLKQVTADNKPDPKDSASQAITKLQNIFNATQNELAKERKKELDASDQQQATLAAINQKWDDVAAANKQKLLDDSKTKADEEAKYKVDTINAVGSAVANAGALADAFANKQTVTGKVLAIAQATIDTYAGVAKALAASAPPLNFIEAAAVGAAGLANVIKIINTKIPADTSGVAAPTLVSAPQLTTTLLPASIANQIQNVRVVNDSQTPIRAYITQSDLANSQAKQDLFNRLSSI